MPCPPEAVGVALDECTLDNGCLLMLAGRDRIVDNERTRAFVARLVEGQEAGNYTVLQWGLDAPWIALYMNQSHKDEAMRALMVGADNVFDVYPDENIPAASNSGIFPYNQISPFGFNGRYLYGRFAVNF